MSDTMKKLNQLYTTVYAQVFSPCGKYLVAGSSFGKIAVFNAGTGSVQGWLWKDVLNMHLQSVSLTNIKTSLGCGCKGNLFPTDYIVNNSLSKPETNALLLNERDGLTDLYAGCGDNVVYVFDLEAQKIRRKFTGHADYVHCLAQTNNDRNELWSGGEDGLVLAWDVRCGGEPVRRLEPHKNEVSSRPAHGKWIGCVAVDSNDEWLLCGGGPALSLWHLRSMSCTETFPTPKSCATCAVFHEDLILSAGTEDCVYCWSFSGEEESKIPTSALSIYSLLIQDTPQHKVLCASGTSSNIDVCSKFKYKDFSLIFA